MFKRWLKQSRGSSYTANVCGLPLVCVPGWHLWTCGWAFVSSSEVYVPKWLKASPARPLVSFLSSLHPQPLSTLLSNLLLSVLGLYIAPLGLGSILSIKQSKALHSIFWVTLPEREGWIREDSAVKEWLTGAEQRDCAVCGGGVLVWWHGTLGTGCFLF